MPSTPRTLRAPDGARIAWSTTGRGDPPVLLTDGIGCAGYVWRRLAPALAGAGRRVLHWNYAGHGRSDPPRELSGATVGRCADDLLAVLDAARAGRAVLVGHSMGVQVVLEAHRRAPGRVAALVLVCGAPGRILRTFHDSPVLEAVFPWARAAFERWPKLGASIFRAVVSSDVAMQYALAFEVNRSLVQREDLEAYFDDLSHVDPAVFVRLLESAAAHDATPDLPSVAVPTLIFAGERDGFTPMHLSTAMHQAIPGSELVVLPGGTHVGPLEHPALVEERLLEFLRTRAPRRTARPRRRKPAARRTRSARPTR
jgi:pimeloyl-ACP methyl ester carboxylesterase